jgi:hypothetical protein
VIAILILIALGVVIRYAIKLEETDVESIVMPPKIKYALE